MTYSWKLRGSPPFNARCATDDHRKRAWWSYWYVENSFGHNALSFPESPGAVFTDRWEAKDIEQIANNGVCG